MQFSAEHTAAEQWNSPHESGRTARTFTVDHKIQSRHSANEVLKQAGLEKEIRIAAKAIPSDNGPQFISRDFKEFIRIPDMTISA